MSVRSGRKIKIGAIRSLAVVVGGVAAVVLITVGLLSSSAFGAYASQAQQPQETTRYEQTSPNVVFAGTWSTATAGTYSKGTLKYTTISGASVTITFSGTRLTWVARKGPDCGKARVRLDGGAPIVVDLYIPSTLYQQAAYSTGTLASGSHTLKIECTGQKNLSSRGKFVDLDAFDVVGPPTGASAATTSTAAPATTTTTTVAPSTPTTAPTATTITAPPASSTSTTVAPSIPATPPVVYDVLDYGAKADGVTDDVAAVQAAVNAAGAAGGGVVYMPPGTYRFYAGHGVDPNRGLGANIELFDGVAVKGAGADKTFVVATRQGASAFGALRKKNISVQDMDISAAGSTEDGVKFAVCTNPLVQNVTAHDIYIGIALYSCVDPVVRECKVYNSDTGIKIGEYANSPEAAVGGLMGGNKVSFRVAGDFSGDPVRRISGTVLRRCASGPNGILLTYAENLTLRDCTSSNVASNGIHISGVNGAILTRCSPAFVTAAANEPGMFAVYGSSINIVVN